MWPVPFALLVRTLLSVIDPFEFSLQLDQSMASSDLNQPMRSSSSHDAPPASAAQPDLIVFSREVSGKFSAVWDMFNPVAGFRPQAWVYLLFATILTKAVLGGADQITLERHFLRNLRENESYQECRQRDVQLTAYLDCLEGMLEGELTFKVEELIPNVEVHCSSQTTRLLVSGS